jgi:hypothetical protein
MKVVYSFVIMTSINHITFVSTMAKRLPLLGNAGAVDSSECSDVKLDRLEEARRTNGLLS